MAPTKSKSGGGAAAAVPRRKRHHYEFGGPLGTLILSIGLPILLYVFAFACNDVSGCPAPSLLRPRALDLDQLKREVGWPADGLHGLASAEATGWVVAYYVLSAVLYRILPATEVEGVQLKSGERLRYRLNAFSSNMLVLSVCAAGTAARGAEFPLWTYMTDNYVQLLTGNVLIAGLIATFVYVRSFSVRPGNSDRRELAPGGCTGNMVYDWFIGRELNPRVCIPLLGEIDLKEWCELRPGMLGWILMNCAFAARQYRSYGYVTAGIGLITVAQAVYVIDSWWNEPAILTTIDITSDGFGFMLAFGDLAWVPFLYSTQTRYLSVHPVELGPVGTAAVVTSLLAGFYIFRASNSQKNSFRTDPDGSAVAHLDYLETRSGSRLLVSGWWGLARHINYLGDWVQSWSYCLPTALAGYTILEAAAPAPAADGASAAALTLADGRRVVAGDAAGWAIPLTYFYIVYFAILLVHRERRDDEKCARKYGEDWERYKRIVRWRIIPGIY